MTDKTCSKCKATKSVDDFHKDKRNKDGLRSYCNTCAKAYYATNKEKLKADATSYKKENKDKIKLKNKAYYVANKEKIKNHSKVYKKANPEKVNKNVKAYNERNKVKILAKARRRFSSSCVSDYFISKLPVTDEPEFIRGYITVKCKTCGKRYTPKYWEIKARAGAFEGKIPGEANFYCSDACKNACPVYSFNAAHIDPRSELAIAKEDKDIARRCKTNHLKEIQCGTRGYNYCEKCGDIIDVELHHTQEVAKYGKGAINSAGHILLCAGCHVEVHAMCAP